MTVYDRERLLSSVDLAGLADELLGPRKGPHGSGMWPCPDPQHAQTGRTPPVSIFCSRRGEQRWRCHGCGAGGSALDLVMIAMRCDVRDAFEVLARRVGSQPEPTRAIPRTAAAIPRSAPGAEFERYVAQCAARLWRRDGAPAREWLMGERRLTADVLRANSVGADPGPSRQPRPDGVPRAGAAAVLPVMEDGRPVYAQLRRLRPRTDQPKYLNLSGSLATNPKVALYRPAERAGEAIIVAEGPIDALSAAAAGYRAAAVLGAASPDSAVAGRLAAMRGRLVLALDSDAAGMAGTGRLLRMLTELQRPAAVLELPDGVNDLNDWMRVDPPAWTRALDAGVSAAWGRARCSLSIG